MKLLLAIILLSSVLFSMETKKQIILGSYSVKTNGVNAAATLKKQIENDEKLKKFMKNNSLNVTSTQISGYTVVSVNEFDTYGSLFRAMKLFQKYYDDAYVLNYPTQSIVEKEMLAEIKEKAMKEEKLEDEIPVVETLKEETLEEDTIEQKRLEELAVKKLADDKRLEEERLELRAQKLEEDRRVEEERIKAQEIAYSNRNKYKENEIDLSDYYPLIALAVLILIIGSIVIYNRSNKEDEDIEV